MKKVLACFKLLPSICIEGAWQSHENPESGQPVHDQKRVPPETQAGMRRSYYAVLFRINFDRVKDVIWSETSDTKKLFRRKLVHFWKCEETIA